MVFEQPSAIALAFMAERASCADSVVRWHIQPHVIVAEVGVKLALGVKGKVGECSVWLEPSELREPLPEKMKAAGITRALDDFGHLILEVEGERERRPRFDGER